jgi:hypothetical protein
MKPIPLMGIPVFVQFKVAHAMLRNSASEAAGGLLKVVFYRMYLHAHRGFNQQSMLIDLENVGNIVSYITPAFHTMAEYDDFYLRHRLLAQSVAFRPGAIGRISGGSSHHVAYRLDGQAWFCSEPAKLDDTSSADAFTGAVHASLSDPTRIYKLDSKYFHGLSDTLEKIISKHGRRFEDPFDTGPERPWPENPLDRVVHLARTFLDCELIIAGAGVAEPNRAADNGS